MMGNYLESLRTATTPPPPPPVQDVPEPVSVTDPFPEPVDAYASSVGMAPEPMQTMVEEEPAPVSATSKRIESVI